METGGAAINIIPRTGGNKFSGNYFTSYTRHAWFDSNNGRIPRSFAPPAHHDHDVSGAFGGPIKRDRLWFFSVGRVWGKEAFKSQNENIWDNKNAGIWGRTTSRIGRRTAAIYTNLTRNINARITWQATQKNKFNFFWDEQDSCQDPCTAPWPCPRRRESVVVRPGASARLQQVSWTNPLTTRSCSKPAVSVNTQLYDFDSASLLHEPFDIPRVGEFWRHGGRDMHGPARQSVCGQPGFRADVRIAQQRDRRRLPRRRNLDDYRPRASISYVTGCHNAKFGYDGGYFSQTQTNKVNTLQESYRYDTPAAATTNCAIPGACGNTSLLFPSDPNNLARRPVPTRVDFNTGSATSTIT